MLRRIIASSFLFLAYLISIPSFHAWAQPNASDPDVTQSLKLSRCYMSKEMQPTEPIQMNTVALEKIAKTIYVVKQTFYCSTESNQQVLADVTIYVRLTDEIATRKPIDRTIEVATCINDLNSTSMKCISEQPLPNLPLESRCGVNKYQLPVIMNTQIVQNNMTKRVDSIEAHSRMFSCRDLDNTLMLKDVVTFTNVYEDVDKMITEKSIESVVCMKSIVNLNVLGCTLQKVA